MSVEFRERLGLRMTFFAGASEPVWLMAEIALLAGNVPKTARRLGVRVSKLRTVLDYVQANARRIGFERETTIEAGFVPPEPVEIFHRWFFRRSNRFGGSPNCRRSPKQSPDHDTAAVAGNCRPSVIERFN